MTELLPQLPSSPETTYRDFLLARREPRKRKLAEIAAVPNRLSDALQSLSPHSITPLPQPPRKWLATSNELSTQPSPTPPHASSVQITQSVTTTTTSEWETPVCAATLAEVREMQRHDEEEARRTREEFARPSRVRCGGAWEELPSEMQDRREEAPTRVALSGLLCVHTDCVRAAHYARRQLCKSHGLAAVRSERAVGVPPEREPYIAEERELCLAVASGAQLAPFKHLSDLCGFLDCGARKQCRGLCRRHYAVAKRLARKQQQRQNETFI